MAFNVFEGARRIGQVILVGIGLIGLILNWNAEPYVSFKYQIPSLWAAPIKIDECGKDDAHELIQRKTSSDKTIHIDLCFKAHAASDGRMLIPFDFNDKGDIRLNEKYNSNVQTYMDTVAGRFSLTSEQAKSLDTIWQAERWKNFAEGLGWTAAILFGTFLVFYLIGWIARGFAGIPSGKDKRGPA